MSDQRVFSLQEARDWFIAHPRGHVHCVRAASDCQQQFCRDFDEAKEFFEPDEKPGFAQDDPLFENMKTLGEQAAAKILNWLRTTAGIYLEGDQPDLAAIIDTLHAQPCQPASVGSEEWTAETVYRYFHKGEAGADPTKRMQVIADLHNAALRRQSAPGNENLVRENLVRENAQLSQRISDQNLTLSELQAELEQAKVYLGKAATLQRKHEITLDENRVTIRDLRSRLEDVIAP